ncbi:MAG: hypothetical protein QXP16_01270 [Candidatus Bathyarchaeia archaeon]
MFPVETYGASYNVTLRAYDYSHNEYVSVSITMDGLPTNYFTPHTFSNLIGTHTFTVPEVDGYDVPFYLWFNADTGQVITSNRTLTLTSGGNFTAAYYIGGPGPGPPPPPPPATYHLTISASSGGITNPPPGTYDYQEGTVISVTAIPDTNYVFDHWELDGAFYGTSNPTTVTMNANHNLYAVFVYSPPPPGVGGYFIPVDKIGLLAPYIGLALTILIALTATIVYVKRFKNKKQKQ